MDTQTTISDPLTTPLQAKKLANGGLAPDETEGAHRP